MSAGSPNPQADVKMLPATTTGNGPNHAGAAAPPAPPPSGATTSSASLVTAASAAPARPPAGAGIIPSNTPTRQLSDLPKDELDHLAEEYGLDPHDYRTPQHLVVALHERRQIIAAMDRDAMLDVIKWGRRPVTYNATKDQIAQEIVRCQSMKFAGLSHRGLVVLARLRGVATSGMDDPVPLLIKKLKKQEGLFAKLNRKRRAMLGSIVGKMIGDDASSGDYQFLPPQQGASGHSSGPVVTPPPQAGTIKDEIEESGLFGGIAGRIKKSADAYVNQKLDEIESRIDRKLDEIDRRLAEWRDKEIANRIRILKITLWASVIVGVLSLIYSYVKVYFPH